MEDPLDMPDPEANTGSDSAIVEYAISRFFTLEEAAAMLPEIRRDFETLFEEVGAAKDDVILTRRMLALRKDAGAAVSEDEMNGLRKKYDHLDDVVTKWVEHFLEKGILVRDLERGLIDFPYQPTDPEHEEMLFLCWEYNEDGLFYFHAPEEGFAGRKPIAVLPD